MENHDDILIEVAYAQTDKQVIVPIKVKVETIVSDAIKQSGILDIFPDINVAINKVGVFGKLTRLDVLLREGDRIEIYRPLIADPKEIRKRRAAEGKKMKKGGGSR
ncbi:MAG: RnfH family protein [Gammaproteobacteria bacterium]|nr:RnfH family protein [Gammaproteobacteria bacterium]